MCKKERFHSFIRSFIHWINTCKRCSSFAHFNCEKKEKRVMVAKRGTEEDQFGKVARLILCRFHIHARAHTLSELRSVEIIYNSCYTHIYTHTYIFSEFPFTIIISEWEQTKAEKRRDGKRVSERGREEKERCKRQCFMLSMFSAQWWLFWT